MDCAFFIFIVDFSQDILGFCPPHFPRKPIRPINPSIRDGQLLLQLFVFRHKKFELNLGWWWWWWCSFTIIDANVFWSKHKLMELLVGKAISETKESQTSQNRNGKHGRFYAKAMFFVWEKPAWCFQPVQKLIVNQIKLMMYSRVGLTMKHLWKHLWSRWPWANLTPAPGFSSARRAWRRVFTVDGLKSWAMARIVFCKKKQNKGP